MSLRKSAAHKNGLEVLDISLDPCSPESTAEESQEVFWQEEIILAEPGVDNYKKTLPSFHMNFMRRVVDYLVYTVMMPSPKETARQQSVKFCREWAK